MNKYTKVICENYKKEKSDNLNKNKNKKKNPPIILR